MRLTILFLTIAWTLGPNLRAQTSPPAARIALINKEVSTTLVADLLLTELSQGKEFTLLEREEVNRVYREQNVSAANQDYLKLGRLLGADGLVMLELSKYRDQSIVSVHLLAVKPGVLVHSTRSPWPIADQNDWSRGMASILHRYASKLNVSAQDAVPLSLVPFQTPLDSPEGRDTANLLSSLLVDRLSREDRVFVLERERMAALVEENDYLQNDADSFWNGAYLLDGIVDRDGYSKSLVTLNARLNRPTGADPIQIEAVGARTNLVDIVAQLCKQIVSALALGDQASWNAGDEAARYFEEAKWNLRWGILEHAAAAAESSWALGRQTAEVALLRHTIYQAINDKGYEEVPAPAKLGVTIRQLQNYQRELGRFAGEGATNNAVWFEWGINMVNAASVRLEKYYFLPEARPGYLSELSDLRALCLDTTRVIEAHRGFTNLVAQGATSSTKARFGWLWHERPEDCVQMYQSMLDSGEFAAVRARFVEGGKDQVRLGGWQWKDRRRAPEVWGAFVDGLCNSTNLASRIDGVILRCAGTSDEAAFAESFQLLLDLFWQKHDGEPTPTDTANFATVIKPLLQKSGAKPLWADLKSRITEVANRKKLDELKNHLTTDNNFSVAKLQEYQHLDFTADEASELITLTKAFDLKLQASGAKTKQAEWQINNLLAKLEASLPPPTPQTEPPNTMPGALPRRPTSSRELGGIPKNAANQTNPTPSQLRMGAPLTVSKFWQKPEAPAGEEHSGSIAAACFRDGLIWLELQDESGSTIAKVDPATLKFELIPVGGTTLIDKHIVGEKGSFTSLINRPRGRLFEVHHDQIYFSTGARLRVYSLSKKVWIDLPMPFEGYGQLEKVGDRLFCTTADSIFEILGETFTLISSARRRPAKSTLDELPSFNWPRLWAGRDGHVCTFINGKFYELIDSASRWQEIGALPEKNGVTPKEGAGLIVVDRTRALGLTGGSPPFRHLLSVATPEKHQNVPRLNVSRSRPSPGNKATLLDPPEWSAPPGLNINLESACYDGTNLWIVCTRELDAAPVDASLAGEPHGGLLLIFRPHRKLPVILPLKLNPPAELSTLSGQHGSIWHKRPDVLRIEHSPVGLLLISRQRPGMWLIPNESLTTSLENWEKEEEDVAHKTTQSIQQRRKSTLTKYDEDKNGRIENQEKRKAISDPAYINFSLASIDANANLQLDLDELKFFDCNGDQQLDEIEVKGVEVVFDALVSAILDETDHNQDGRLDTYEIMAAITTPRFATFAELHDWANADNHPDLTLSALELKTLLRRHLNSGLMIPAISREVVRKSAGGKSLTQEDVLSERVRLYWKGVR